MSRKGTAEQWSSRIKDYRASGERAAAWCERHQVSPRQLYYWMAKLKKADQQTPPTGGPRWVALSVEEAVPVEAAPILVRVGTVVVEVRAGFEPAVFADVIMTLKTLC
jgi:transposase-like protein